MFWPTHSLDPLSGQRRRASSYDTSGGNRDYVVLAPGERRIVFQHKGSPGRISRIWMTFSTEVQDYLEKIRLTLHCDGVCTVGDAPLGMLTATGPWSVNDTASAMADVMRARLMNRDAEGAGFGSFNLHWPMPFDHECSLEFFNGCDAELMVFFYVDYFVDLPREGDMLWFHATHNRQIHTTPQAPAGHLHDPDQASGNSRAEESRNLSRDGNHVFADIRDHRGFYAGTFLVVESHPDREGKWYEGDDMFFVDNDNWPPTLHGTGTEDYFGMAWGIHRPFQALDHGVTHYERNITDHDRYYDGRIGVYRWHLRDPIPFTRSLHASIEAGHANDCRQHYESVAFWYGRPL